MVNVFSFCLYGPENPRYYPGMLENIYLAGKYFPTWKVYIYYAPDVTQAMINHLAACSTVKLIPTGETGAKNMIHRFFAIDEPEVELMMVRDADSRIHWKDRWAIRGFLESPCLAHTIRDNVQHGARMMGGLWGMKKMRGINIRAEYATYVEDPTILYRTAHDQNFLTDAIYPKVLPYLLIHRSNAPVFRNENNVVVFPFEWSNDIYCGRVDFHFVDTPEPKPNRLGFLPNVPLRLYDTPQPGAPAVTPPSSGSTPSFVPTRPETHALHFLNKK